MMSVKSGVDHRDKNQIKISSNCHDYFPFIAAKKIKLSLKNGTLNYTTNSIVHVHTITPLDSSSVELCGISKISQIRKK